MANNVEVVVTAKDQASAAIQRVGNALGGLQNAAAPLSNAMGALGLVGGLGTVASLVGMASAISSVTKELDALDESAQNAGVGAVALSEMRYAASFAGVEAEKLDNALAKLNVKIVDAANGGKESAAVFQAMGISVRDANGNIRSTEDIMADVADKFASYVDGSKKSALAAELFGEKAGPKLVAYLSQGREGIRQYTGVTEDAVKASAEFQDNLNRLNEHWEETKRGIVGAIVPALNQMIDEFNAARDAAGGLMGALALLFKQSPETLNDPRAKIAEDEEKIKKLQKKVTENMGSANPVVSFGVDADLNKINALKEELRFLNLIRVSRGLLTEDELRDEGRRSAQRGGTNEAPTINKAQSGPNKGQSDVDSLIKSLQTELDKLNELSEAEKLLRDIQAGRYSGASAASIARAQELAAEVDWEKKFDEAQKEQDEIIKANAQARKERFAEEQKQQDEATAAYERGLGPIEKYAAEIERLTDLYNKGAFGVGDEGQRRFEVAIDGARKSIEELGNDVSEFAKQAQRNIQDALGETIKKTFKGDTNDILSMWIDMLLEMEAQAMAADIGKWLFGGTKGGGSWLFSLFSGGSSGGPSTTSAAAAASSFGGGRASGGAVSPSNFYLVGENGPEIFAPDIAGNIIPNNQLGGSVAIHQTIHVHVGSDVSRAEVYDAAAQAAREAQVQIMEGMRRGRWPKS